MEPQTIEFTNRHDGRTEGAYVGTASEEVFTTDPDWYRSDTPPASAKAAKAAAPAPTTLGDHTVAQLKVIAAERGVDLGNLKAKAKIIEAIEAGPGNPTPNPGDLVPTPETLTDEQLDEVVDLLELELADTAPREAVLEAIAEHEDKASVLEAVQTVTAD